jgi:hypothetical protein
MGRTLLLDPRLLNLVRVLFVSGRDVYERKTLDSKEYDRRQDERSRSGCIGCLVVLGLLAVFLLLALNSNGR